MGTILPSQLTSHHLSQPSQLMVHQSQLHQSQFTTPPRSPTHIKHPLSRQSMKLPKSLNTIHHHPQNPNPTNPNPSLHLGQHTNLDPQIHLHQNRHIKRMRQSMYQHPNTSTSRQSSSIKVLPHQYMSMRNHLVGTAQLLKPKVAIP